MITKNGKFVISIQIGLSILMRYSFKLNHPYSNTFFRFIKFPVQDIG